MAEASTGEATDEPRPRPELKAVEDEQPVAEVGPAPAPDTAAPAGADGETDAEGGVVAAEGEAGDDDLDADAGRASGADASDEGRAERPDGDGADDGAPSDGEDGAGAGADGADDPAGVNPTAQAAMNLAAGAASSLKGVAADLARSRRWMVRDTPNGNRLRADIAKFAAELPGLVERAGPSSEKWAPTAEALAVGAAEALARGDNLEAWDLLWAGQREALDGLRAEEVRAGATATLDRAKGLLEPGAVTAAKKELAGLDDASGRAARSMLREARLLVDRLSLEVYGRLHQEARRISAFSMLTVAFLVAGAVATLGGIPAGSGDDALAGASGYLTVITFGAAGAVISLVLPWREKRARPALLDFVNPVDLMVLRIAMGAAFAIIFVAVMQAGVQGVVQIEGAQAYPWALAAGFSERLLDRRLEQLDAEARDLDSH